MIKIRWEICKKGFLNKKLINYKTLDRWEEAAGVSTENYYRFWQQCDYCKSVTNIMSPENIKKLDNISSSYYKVDFDKSEVKEKFERLIRLPKEY